ncbi:MAG: TraC family protein [Pseudobdellovibrionaceae bacterium]
MSAEIMKKLPFFRFEDHTMVYNDASLGVGFKLQGIDISCATPDAINSFCQKLENFLVGLPDGLKIQVFYRLTNYAQKTIDHHLEITKDCDEHYKPIQEARSEFLNEKFKNDSFYLPEVYLFVRSRAVQFKKRSFFESKQKFEDIPAREFLQLKEQFYTLVSQVESSMRSAGLEPVRLLEVEWYKLLFSYFNLDRAENIGFPVLRDPSDPLAPLLTAQIAMTDISVSEKHLDIGPLKFRSVSLGLLPQGESHSSMIEGLTKLSFHFWLSQNIRTLEQRKEVEKLELRRRVASSMASGSQNVSDIESESSLSQVEDLLRELNTGSERMVASDLNIIFWGHSEDELEKKTEEILRSFRGMSQAEGLVETFALEDAFFNAAPSVCEGFRHHKMKTSNCAHLMPLYSTWMGNKSPVVLLSNREGAPFSIDPFAKELPNWNGLVFGGSGAGKSFTISSLMLQFCAQKPKPKIVWIDNGASSEKLIEVLDGEFIDLHLNSGIRLNMFDLEDGETKPTSSKIKLILGCLELILKDEDKPGLPKREKALLEEAIFNCYKEYDAIVPTLSTLKDILRNHPVLEMKKHADILFSWTGETAYGQMLDGLTNVKLNKDLVTIEIKGLDNHRELKDIFLLLLTSYIKEEAARDLAKPYLLIIDEAHRLFKTPSGKDFAIESYRVFRKYNAGILCISQNYRDFMADRELADALMPNTTSVFILRQRKIDWDDFKTTFDFNDSQVEAVKSLEIVKGKYSEFFFMQDESQAVVRLEPEPLAYWICTTDGNEKSKVEDLRLLKPDVPLIEILKELAKGDSN